MRRIVWMTAVTLLVAGCSDSDPAEQPSTSTTTTTIVEQTTTTVVVPTTAESTEGGLATTPGVPQRGGSVTIGLPFVPSRLNELNDDGFAAARWIRALIRPAAYIEQPDGTRFLHLVTDDPSFDNAGMFVGEDGSFEVTWNIDPSARWSDGERVVAADFAVFHEAGCEGVDDAFEGEFLEADPGQVRVRFPAPTPLFRDAVAHVIPAHVVEAATVCVDDAVTWPSTGPFLIDVVGPSGIELFRNPAYWRRDATGARLPYLDGLAFREIGDDAASMLASGAVDVVDGAPFMASGGPGLPRTADLVTGHGAVWEFVTFEFGVDNRNEASLNEHLSFRQALIHALDRPAIAAAVGWLPSDGLGGASSLDGWSAYDYDPEEARALLEDLCLDLERDCVVDPPTVVLTTTSNADERPVVVGLLADAWSDIGVSVELQLEDSSLFFGESAPLGTYDVGMWAWLVEPSPESRLGILGVFDPSDPGPTGRNWYRWGVAGTADADREAVAAFGELLAGVEPRGVGAVLRTAEQILADEVVVIPIGTRPVGVAHDSRVIGPTPTAAPAGFTWNAEFWFIAAE